MLEKEYQKEWYKFITTLLNKDNYKQEQFKKIIKSI